MMHTNYKRTGGGPKGFFAFLLFAAIATLAFGAIVMLLWNSVMLTLFDVSAITYWQAVGLFVLCRILFGNLRPHRRDGKPGFGGSAYWKDKWSIMTDEEKVKFKEEWRKRCDRRKQ